MNKYLPVIGLEIHVELNTISKMFCQCSADYFLKPPNSETCPVCLGLPGALPVPNKKAIEYTQIIARSLNCTLNSESKFDRKHYFYADLPKGYQISQYDQPFGSEGHVNINNKKFRIQRVHLEEDTGKLIHKPNATLVDFNRSGVPLVEIVTYPDFDNSNDVKDFLEYLHLLIKQYLKLSNANMEEGSMRLEPNISLSKLKGKLANYKIEVKNINSFKYVKKAIDYELTRQADILNSGQTLKNETRGYDENKAITFSQRIKEEAKDYRYFPEPDIPPFSFAKNELNKLILPELPFEKLNRYKIDYKLNQNQAVQLIKNYDKAEIFEKLLKKPEIKSNAVQVANFLINRKISKKESLDTIYSLLENARRKSTLDINVILKELPNILKDNKKAVNDYKSGKENALYFIIGQILKKFGKDLDIDQLKTILISELNK